MSTDALFLTRLPEIQNAASCANVRCTVQFMICEGQLQIFLAQRRVTNEANFKQPKRKLQAGSRFHSELRVSIRICSLLVYNPVPVKWSASGFWIGRSDKGVVLRKLEELVPKLRYWSTKEHL